MFGYLPNRIALRLKSGFCYVLDLEGNILVSENGKHEGNGTWKILGFLRRWNSGHYVTLADAIDGIDIGHGYVVDLDHGTRRVWAMPKNRRASSVKTFYQGKE